MSNHFAKYLVAAAAAISAVAPLQASSADNSRESAQKQAFEQAKAVVGSPEQALRLKNLSRAFAQAVVDKRESNPAFGEKFENALTPEDIAVTEKLAREVDGISQAVSADGMFGFRDQKAADMAEYLSFQNVKLYEYFAKAAIKCQTEAELTQLVQAAGSRDAETSRLFKALGAPNLARLFEPR